jgi:cell division protein FtsQ
MPLVSEDRDGEELPRRGPSRFGVQRLGEAQREGPDQDSAKQNSPDRSWPSREKPGKHWWRPASTAGRVFLLLAALTMLSGLSASAYLLKTYLDRDVRFRIDGTEKIEAAGLTEVSRDQLLPVFGEDIGRNVFHVPLAERRRQLEEIPWIERATVMRLLPDRIRVSVVERQPVAFARQGEQFGLVDANGVLLSMPAATMAQRHYSFPVVAGIDPRDRLAARQARMKVYQRLMADLDSGGQRLSAQISEVDLTDPEDARVTMQDDTTLLHFGQDRFLERYQRYKANIRAWRQQYPKLAAVDLRYDRQVVLEMAPGTNVAQVAADQQAAADAAGEKPPDLADAGAQQVVGASSKKPASAAKLSADSAGLGAGGKSLVRHSRPIAKVKPGGVGAKPAGIRFGQAKTAAAKDKAARAKSVQVKAKQKKRAEAKGSALKVSKRKTVQTAPPAASAGMGQ